MYKVSYSALLKVQGLTSNCDKSAKGSSDGLPRSAFP